MTKQIALTQYAHGHMIGMRPSAVPLRKMIETSLAVGEEVAIDFSGVEVTQSFVDELIGAVILRSGVNIMSKVVLKGCSANTQGIIRFVVSDRARQHARINKTDCTKSTSTFGMAMAC